MKTEEQMLRDDLAQCEADGEQMSTELAKLREAVKTLRDSVAAGLVAFQRDPDVRFAACWLGAEQKMKAALAATENLVEG